MKLNIKASALSIVTECERVERVEKAIMELEQKHFQYINFYKYISQGNKDNLDLHINIGDISEDSAKKIRELTIDILKTSLS